MMRIRAEIPRINASGASKAVTEVVRDILRRRAVEQARLISARMYRGLTPGDEPQHPIDPDTRERGTRTPLIRTGQLANSWRAHNTALGAVVRPEPSRDRISTILERQGFNIHGISEQDMREILAEVERASNRMLSAIEDNITMVEVGNG